MRYLEYKLRKLSRLLVKLSFFIGLGFTRRRIPSVQREIKVNSELVVEIDSLIQRNSRKIYPHRDIRIRFLDGFSGQSFRGLINDLLKIDPEGVYLEVGVWKGSTAAAALSANKNPGILIDKFDSIPDIEHLAEQNLRSILKRKNVELLKRDYEKEFDVLPRLSNVRFFFFDGGHTFTDHLFAAKSISKMKNSWILFLVDDYTKWNHIHNATMTGLTQIDSDVQASWIIYPHKSDSFGRFGRWHNGLGMFLIKHEVSL
jgi:hypothetical protein